MGMPGIGIAFHECPVCCYFAAAQEWQRLTARLAESNLLLRSLVGMAQNWRWIVFIASSNWPWQWVEAVPLSLLHALLNQEKPRKDCWTPSFRFCSVLVPSCPILSHFDPGIRHQGYLGKAQPGVSDKTRIEVRLWASMRSQTVMRTVQGAAARRVPSWNGLPGPSGAIRGPKGNEDGARWGQMGVWFWLFDDVRCFVWFQIESWENVD
jgi:hypothetical protein